MLAEFFARDRLIMTGLVILGLLTVLAGVASGRSSVDYVLDHDARSAATTWAESLDKQLGGQMPSGVPNKDVQVLDAGALRAQFAADAHHQAGVPVEGGSGQARMASGDADRLILGWVLDQTKEEHVSRLNDFVLLGADQLPLEGQAELLKRWGCDQVQGPYCGRAEADAPEGVAASLHRPLVA
jgi:hypothetical protein